MSVADAAGLLGFTGSASMNEIHNRFREQAKEWHPDTSKHEPDLSHGTFFGVPYLGSIPIDPAMVKAGDEGRPYVLRHSDTPAWNAVDAVMENLAKRVES